MTANSESRAARLGLILFLVSLAANFWQAHHRTTMQAEAVKRGAAEWRVDINTGETQFIWKAISTPEIP